MCACLSGKNHDSTYLTPLPVANGFRIISIALHDRIKPYLLCSRAGGQPNNLRPTAHCQQLQFELSRLVSGHSLDTASSLNTQQGLTKLVTALCHSNQEDPARAALQDHNHSSHACKHVECKFSRCMDSDRWVQVQFGDRRDGDDKGW